ncbi:helix-turn-helix domain-containing protein [Shewanella sp. 10N.7]|uniref:helix-turn-helix domain-containing protein n=1 Tax=Shewanella sp. 10N.7 TaxID=2885093 RepID=UPI001E3E1A71|nr:helix-turn-helix transcriptional regulator [Shewanella sp. 10N.7]MCC4834855.1 helix-turn-helix domain-containing protein [Shewanella sp. 10N.7]
MQSKRHAKKLTSSTGVMSSNKVETSIAAVDAGLEGAFIPLLRAEYIAPFVARLKDFDNNVYPLIEQAGLPASLLTSNHDYVSEQAVLNLLKLISAKLGSKRFSEWLFQVARTIFVPQHLAKITLNGTVKQAIVDFTHVVNLESKQTNVHLKTGLGKVWFVRHRLKNDPIENSVAEQFALTMMVELVRSLTQAQWQPADIALQSATEVDYLNVLKLNQPQVFYGRQVTALSISDSVLAGKVKLKHGWQGVMIPVVEGPKGFVESLQFALLPYLSLGRIPVTTAADLLGLSVRTLQRRLSEEGMSYRQMIEGICFKQAKEMLSDGAISVTQISATLGYSDVAHFSRAFKRMSGHSPRVFRQNISIDQ